MNCPLSIEEGVATKAIVVQLGGDIWLLKDGQWEYHPEERRIPEGHVCGGPTPMAIHWELLGKPKCEQEVRKLYPPIGDCKVFWILKVKPA